MNIPYHKISCAYIKNNFLLYLMVVSAIFYIWPLEHKFFVINKIYIYLFSNNLLLNSPEYGGLKTPFLNMEIYFFYQDGLRYVIPGIISNRSE